MFKVIQSTITFKNIFVESSLDVTWVIDGDYTPVIGFFFKDGTSKVYPTTNFVIHVYPKELSFGSRLR